MPWPLSQDYNEAIQSPASSLGDPELQGGEPVTGALGMPMPRSGNFADVYEFVGASGAKWAIKCFTRAVPGLRERYSEISKHLTQAKLPFTVDFDFLTRGIRIGGDWYPVLKMQWVEGFLLNEFVRNNLDKPAQLEALGQIWLRMARCLRDANMAHADLQHGNVLLVPGRKPGSLAVKLIDYDGMWVPALANNKSGELGHPAYQHPQRLREGTYSAEVDRFPLLAIACALRALVVAGKPLWDRYDNGDNLLFREADLRDPAASPLLKELWNINDAAVHDLTGHLVIGLTGAMAQVPLFQELMNGDVSRELPPEEDMKVGELLGRGAILNRPSAVATAFSAVPIKTSATPVSANSRSRAARPPSAWESLAREKSTPKSEPKANGDLLRIGIAAAVVAAVLLVVLAAVGIGAAVILKSQHAEKIMAPVLAQKGPPANEKTKLPLKKEEPRKEEPAPLPKQPNGLFFPGEANCAAMAYRLNVGNGFDITKSWVLYFDFFPTDLAQSGQMLLWGDDRPGRDAIYVLQRNDKVEAVLENCHDNTGHGMQADLTDAETGQWNKLRFCYHAASREVELSINNRLIRKERSKILPSVDRPMPVFLGGANYQDQRWRGRIRNLGLGNT